MPRQVPRARLSALLWPGRGEEQARASLRQALHDVTDALGRDAASMLVAGRETLGLREGAVWTDVAELERVGPGDGSARAGAALALASAALLEDLVGLTAPFDAWLEEARRRLVARARTLGEAVLDRATDTATALNAARHLLGIDPTTRAPGAPSCAPTRWAANAVSRCRPSRTARARCRSTSMHRPRRPRAR